MNDENIKKIAKEQDGVEIGMLVMMKKYGGVARRITMIGWHQDDYPVYYYSKDSGYIERTDFYTLAEIQHMFEWAADHLDSENNLVNVK